MENATPIPHDGSQPVHAPSPPSPGYETRDASIRAIMIFMVALFVVGGSIHLVVWGLMRGFEHRNAAEDLAPSPFANDHAPVPEPRLQPSIGHQSLPHEDVDALRERWRRELSSYGPVDGEPGRARIPVQRAMDMMIERGLPAAAARPAAQPASPPATRPAGGTP